MNTLTPILPELTYDGAERLSARISVRLDAIADNYTAVMPLIREALNRNAYAVLGYNSPGAYVKDRFGDALSKLAPDVRREVVKELSSAGMSTRAIAPVLRVDNKTVHNDLKRTSAGVEFSTPAPIGTEDPAVVEALDAIDQDVADALDNDAPSPDWPEDVNLTTGEVAEPVAPVYVAPKVITGLDGKSYTQPTNTAPRRKALTDSAKDIGWELRKASEKLQRMTEDDRFSRNKNEVAAHIRGHLMFTVEVCQDLLDMLNQSQED
jgi:hypothetical protein